MTIMAVLSPKYKIVKKSDKNYVACRGLKNPFEGAIYPEETFREQHLKKHSGKRFWVPNG
jgi:hypothetical protein